LPDVDEVVDWPAPWLDPQSGPAGPEHLAGLVTQMAMIAPGEAVIFTSFHQSALPYALLLRMAGSEGGGDQRGLPVSLLRCAAPGTARHPGDRAGAVRRGGRRYALPAGDDGRLKVRAAPSAGAPRRPVCGRAPGASDAGARLSCAAVRRDRARDRRHRPTCRRHRLRRGAPLTAHVAGTDAVDLGGRTSLAELAALIGGADCLVVNSTGPAHLAAAVGTPVVSMFAPTVSSDGGRRAGCRTSGSVTGPHPAGTQATVSRPGHPCLDGVTPVQVQHAIDLLGVP
jgi:hypothetical protein